ncbi:MAG TPA: VOC family protein [Gemmatimonadales bacterium]|jgi:catechol-2,3-dioxygenase|nr:VOC family protein [Gemmatimonadales bacterium]
MSAVTPFAAGHVGLNVRDLARAKRFYQTVFGFDLLAESEEGGREFAFLGQGGAPVLTLWQQADGGFARERAGLHHLAFQAGSIDDVRAAERRVRELGVAIHHDGIVPHAEGAESGGIYFEDPDGIRLEIYAATGAGERPAPVSGAPTCGFF